MATEDETDDADKKLEARISAAVTGATKALRKELADMKTQIAARPAPPAAQPPAEGTEPPAGAEFEVARSLKEASARIAALEAENKAEKKRNDDNAKKQKRDRERGALTELARKRGVPDPLIKGFVALHHGEGTSIDSDEDSDGNARVFVKSGDEREDMATWADKYFKSDEGKHYLPPKRVAGAGMGRAGTGGGADADHEPTREELGAALMQHWRPNG